MVISIRGTAALKSPRRSMRVASLNFSTADSIDSPCIGSANDLAIKVAPSARSRRVGDDLSRAAVRLNRLGLCTGEPSQARKRPADGRYGPGAARCSTGASHHCSNNDQTYNAVHEEKVSMFRAERQPSDDTRLSRQIICLYATRVSIFALCAFKSEIDVSLLYITHPNFISIPISF